MSKLITGVVFGLLTGAAAGLMLAPQSGDSLKTDLRRRLDQVIEEGRRAAAERRAELEAQFAEAKRAPRNA
jgi:gas vesicle protein